MGVGYSVPQACIAFQSDGLRSSSVHIGMLSEKLGFHAIQSNQQNTSTIKSFTCTAGCTKGKIFQCLECPSLMTLQLKRKISMVYNEVGWSNTLAISAGIYLKKSKPLGPGDSPIFSPVSCSNTSSID